MNSFIKQLSHVGVRTSDLERSLKWYTEALGADEAFRLHRDGRLVIVYLQLSRDTFVELFAPRPGQTEPELYTHFSIEVEDIEAAVADLMERLPAESVRNPEIKTGLDGSRIFNFFDPDGNRIEFQQFPPDSQQGKAIARFATQA